MGYYECTLTDLGYENPHNNEAITDISGLDNRCACAEDPGHGCQCFKHRGVIGWPDVATAFCDEITGVSVICIAETAPAGAVEMTEEQFLAKLMADYGWPEGTAMGADGRPHGPARTIADDAYYQVGG